MIIQKVDASYRKEFAMPVQPPQKRYYLQHNAVDGDWELWEVLPDGTHDLKASFYDGDDHGSPLADITLSFLSAVTEVGAQTEIREE